MKEFREKYGAAYDTLDMPIYTVDTPLAVPFSPNMENRIALNFVDLWRKQHMAYGVLLDVSQVGGKRCDGCGKTIPGVADTSLYLTNMSGRMDLVKDAKFGCSGCGKIWCCRWCAVMNAVRHGLTCRYQDL